MRHHGRRGGLPGDGNLSLGQAEVICQRVVISGQPTLANPETRRAPIRIAPDGGSSFEVGGRTIDAVRVHGHQVALSTLRLFRRAPGEGQLVEYLACGAQLVVVRQPRGLLHHRDQLADPAALELEVGATWCEALEEEIDEAPHQDGQSGHVPRARRSPQDRV